MNGNEPKWQRRTLLASDNKAQLNAIIEECDDGQWRASAVFFVEEGNATLTQSSGIEMFSSEEAALEWVESAAATRGFTKYHLEKRILPGSR